MIASSVPIVKHDDALETDRRAGPILWRPERPPKGTGKPSVPEPSDDDVARELRGELQALPPSSESDEIARRIWVLNEFVLRAGGKEAALILGQTAYWTQLAKDGSGPRCRYQPLRFIRDDCGVRQIDASSVWWYTTTGQIAQQVGRDRRNRDDRHYVAEQIRRLVRGGHLSTAEIVLAELQEAGGAAGDTALHDLLSAADPRARVKIQLPAELRALAATNRGNRVHCELIREVGPNAAILFTRIAYVLLHPDEYATWIEAVRIDEMLCDAYVVGREQLFRQTGLTVKQIRRAEKVLTDRGLLVTKVLQRRGEAVHGWHIPHRAPIAERRRQRSQRRARSTR